MAVLECLSSSKMISRKIVHTVGPFCRKRFERTQFCFSVMMEILKSPKSEGNEILISGTEINVKRAKLQLLYNFEWFWIRNFAWFFTTEEEKKRKIKINQLYGCYEIWKKNQILLKSRGKKITTLCYFFVFFKWMCDTHTI